MAHKPRPAVDVEGLQHLGVEALRESWRAHLGEEPPPLRAPELLRRELAWRLEAQRYSDIDPSLKQRLDRLARQSPRSGARVAASVRPEVGSTLMREWDGVAYSVVVLEQGFLFEGETYRSLSQIARRITGVRWSGPRFFGLTERASR